MKKKIVKFIIGLLILIFTGLFSLRTEAAFDNNTFLKFCETGTLQEIEDAIKSGADVNARAETGLTALMIAARKNNHEVIRALINNGAYVNANNGIGTTALVYAALYNNPEVVAELINSGADVNKRNREGMTALMMAVRYNNPAVIG